MQTASKRGFGSDNNARVHPDIIRAMVRVNKGHTINYGDDPHTRSALARFRKHFGKNSTAFLVFNGTAANVLGLSAVLRPYNAVLCADLAHLSVDECGAPERFTGCKLIPIHAPHGKLTPELVRQRIHGAGDQHHVQPKVVSIAQSTELGTVYTAAELRQLAEFAHENGLLLHVDGARLANAAASLRLGLREITADVGVDVLSFDGTKNGVMYGAAVVFFNNGLANDFEYVRKQGMQLASKMQFIAAQYEALLSNDLWLRNAQHANDMARILAREIQQIDGIRITHPVEANAVFVKAPKDLIRKIRKRYFFYTWGDGEARLMTSFDTTVSDIKRFISYVKSVLVRYS
ncbi:MAG: low specificity L-threonine aldolase [Candidatus Micrarchaeota archaeon]